ncbi:transporter [Halarchaeum salinum]|uniref:Transporter n=1 Tax=Halarchaeum salinum TaxID=489912 RepID=A0AAV3S6K0_9EURY
MATALSAAFVIHFVFAALWTGSVCYFAYAVLPLGRDGDLSASALESTTGKLTTISRVSAIVQLLTGGFMASPMGVATTTAYWSSTSGYLVAAMVVLWLALATLTEMGASTIRDGIAVDKVRSPARDASTRLRAASVVALLLLVDAGALAAGL